jgi:glucan 1,3-beta-glucosidase
MSFAMGSLRALLLLALVLQAVCEQFEIPVVENIVAHVLATHDKYVRFQGNHTNSTSHSASGSTSLSRRQSPPYWYENINHQGISAFGPSGYQVFRNVKDYGAQGMSNICIDDIGSHSNPKIIKVTE